MNYIESEKLMKQLVDARSNQDWDSVDSIADRLQDFAHGYTECPSCGGSKATHYHAMRSLSYHEYDSNDREPSCC